MNTISNLDAVFTGHGDPVNEHFFFHMHILHSALLHLSFKAPKSVLSRRSAPLSEDVLPSRSVILFSTLNKLLFGYMDPASMCFYINI